MKLSNLYCISQNPRPCAECYDIRRTRVARLATASVVDSPFEGVRFALAVKLLNWMITSALNLLSGLKPETWCRPDVLSKGPSEGVGGLIVESKLMKLSRINQRMCGAASISASGNLTVIKRLISQMPGQSRRKEFPAAARSRAKNQRTMKNVTWSTARDREDVPKDPNRQWQLWAVHSTLSPWPRGNHRFPVFSQGHRL
jgi:hypothetical protein